MNQRFTMPYGKFVLEYEEGKEAYFADVEEWDNPYSAQFETTDYLNWNRGWLDAKAEDRADVDYGNDRE
jgi:hypothetical protein